MLFLMLGGTGEGMCWGEVVVARLEGDGRVCKLGQDRGV